jgi:hypothetical protein
VRRHLEFLRGASGSLDYEEASDLADSGSKDDLAARNAAWLRYEGTFKNFLAKPARRLPDLRTRKAAFDHVCDTPDWQKDVGEAILRDAFAFAHKAKPI